MSESFVLFTDSWAGISMLTREQRGDLLTAFMALHDACEMPSLDFSTQLVFNMIKPLMLKNKQKYNDTKAKRSQAAKTRWAKADAKNANECKCTEADANECKCMQVHNLQCTRETEDASVTVNVNVNDNVNGNVNDNVNVNDISPQPPKGAEPAQAEVKDDSLPPKKYRRDDFVAWYEAYPKHVKKKPAASAWAEAVKKNVLPDINFLLADIERQKAGNPRWRDGFIPDPTTYLNQRRWNDNWTAPQPVQNAQAGYPRFQPTGKLQGMDLHNANMEAAKVALAMRAQARAEGRPTSPYAMEANNER